MLRQILDHAPPPGNWIYTAKYRWRQAVGLTGKPEASPLSPHTAQVQTSPVTWQRRHSQRHPEIGTRYIEGVARQVTLGGGAVCIWIDKPCLVQKGSWIDPLSGSLRETVRNHRQKNFTLVATLHVRHRYKYFWYLQVVVVVYFQTSTHYIHHNS